MHRVFRIRQAIVALEVYTADNSKVSLDVPTSMTLNEVTAMAYEAVYDAEESKGTVADDEASAGATPVAQRASCCPASMYMSKPPVSLGSCASHGPFAAPLELCRLRRFVPQTSRPAETFEGREDKPLHEVGVVNSATLLLESRKEDEVCAPWLMRVAPRSDSC